MAEPGKEEMRYMKRDGSNTVKLSLTDFLIQARKYLANLAASLDSVQYAYTLLNEQETVWPDQCDYAVRSIEMVEKPIQDFCTLLDKTTHLPTDVIPLRYELMTELSYVKEQTQLLNSTMPVFRASCKSTSRQSTKQKREILHRLDLLLQGGEDIAEQSSILFDQVR